MVPIVEAMFRLRYQERLAHAVGPAMAVYQLRSGERKRPQCCSQSGKMAGFELPGDRAWRPCKTGYAGGGL